MILKGARVAVSANVWSHEDLTIKYGRVLFSRNKQSPRASSLDLAGFAVLPGLINAHDHLEFNLFPRLGCGPYQNAAQWAKDIYRPSEEPVLTHLKIPKPIRLWWGGLKNLLSGVTSVAHHNPYEKHVFEDNFPVRVVRRLGWAHSLLFSSDVFSRFRHTPFGAPFIIHAGEGIDQDSRQEIYCLKKAKILGKSTVLVHGVALEESDVDILKAAGAALVWCPTSNLFLLGRTLSIHVLHSEIPIALGTDSALSAQGDLIDEIRMAGHYVSSSRLYRMITTEAARILRLDAGQGRIQEGGFADLLVVRDPGGPPAAALTNLRPELVFLRGRLKLISTCLASRLNMSNLPGFEPIEIEGRGRWLVRSNVTQFIATTKRILGHDIFLAGRRVIA